MLNIVVSEARPFAGIDVSHYNELINTAKNEGHLISSIGYLHGDLESKMGYDIGVCLNAEEFLNEDESIKEGIYDAIVFDYDSPCRAFIWEGRRWKNDIRCLIVDIMDERSVKYAQNCYSTKRSDL